MFSPGNRRGATKTKFHLSKVCLLPMVVLKVATETKTMDEN